MRTGNSRGYFLHAIDAGQGISWQITETDILVDTAVSQNIRLQGINLDEYIENNSYSSRLEESIRKICIPSDMSKRTKTSNMITLFPGAPAIILRREIKTEIYAIKANVDNMEIK